MILTASEGSLRTMSEIPSEIIEEYSEKLLIGILLKLEMFGEDFFASNI